jgi:beta-N-acetylhexosaminidase
MNAPYYLDTTEINKLDAYFCVYGKTQPFIEMAVRALFGEAIAIGKSPVSIEGVRYDLATQLSPDPEQLLSVRLLEEIPEGALPPVTVHVQVGPVLDRNGLPVPDGTTVTFAASYRGGAGSVALDTATMLGGMAEADFTLAEPGRAEIAAQSGEATSQQPLALNIAAPPTPTPTVTPTPTATALPAATPSATPSPSATPAPTVTDTPQPTQTPAPVVVDETGDSGHGALRPVDGMDLLAALGATLLAGVIAFGSGRRARSTSKIVRLGLLVLIGGLVGYLVYGGGWLRPEMWLVPDAEARLAAGRLAAAALAFAFSLASMGLERATRGRR